MRLSIYALIGIFWNSLVSSNHLDHRQDIHLDIIGNYFGYHISYDDTQEVIGRFSYILDRWKVKKKPTKSLTAPKFHIQADAGWSIHLFWHILDSPGFQHGK